MPQSSALWRWRTQSLEDSDGTCGRVSWGSVLGVQVPRSGAGGLESRPQDLHKNQIQWCKLNPSGDEMRRDRQSLRAC